MADYAIRLPTESTLGRDGQEANVRLINGYAEQMGVDQDGKAPYVVYACPGLTRWDSGTFMGAERGSIELNSSNLVYLLGTQLVNFDSTGTPTTRGMILGSDRVTMAKNRNGTPQIGIVSYDSHVYYLLQGSSLTQPSEANLPAPNSITYLKGNFFYGIPDGRMFASPQESGTSIEALSYGTANADSGGIVRLFAHSGYMYAFGPRNMEIWQYTGDTPFPLKPAQQYIQLGLAAPFSLAETDRGMIWLDHKGVVRFGRDGGALRISTHTIERAVSELSVTDRADLTASICTFEGHECYVLSSPNRWTFVYDLNMERWFQRKSYSNDGWIASGFTWFNGQYICGSTVNGRLYKLDMANYKEDGAGYVLELWCENAHNFPTSAFIDSFDLDIVSGVGTGNDTEDDDPHIAIDYSDDGGKNFYGERLVSMGKIGVYRQLIRTGRWGRVTQKGRIWRLRASAGVLRAVIQATLRGRPGL